MYNFVLKVHANDSMTTNRIKSLFLMLVFFLQVQEKKFAEFVYFKNNISIIPK